MERLVRKTLIIVLISLGWDVIDNERRETNHDGSEKKIKRKHMQLSYRFVPKLQTERFLQSELISVGDIKTTNTLKDIQTDEVFFAIILYVFIIFCELSIKTVCSSTMYMNIC